LKIYLKPVAGEARAESQNSPPGTNLVDLTDSIADFADTAAFVSLWDMVISVDTAVAHLARVMGKPE
jgi:ADP-heptose:LPS heptosyltransferase